MFGGDATLRKLGFSFAGSDLLKSQLTKFPAKEDIVKTLDKLTKCCILFFFVVLKTCRNQINSDCCFNQTRTCSLKLLYSKLNWHCVGLSDMLAPTARLILKGERIVFTAPYQSVSASLGAKDPEASPTLSALSRHFMSFSLQELVNAGGSAVVMKEGDFLWIPHAYIVAEFNLGVPSDNDNISEHLSWVAMTKYHCGAESVSHVMNSVNAILSKCCQPSEKWYEKQLQAGSVCSSPYMVTLTHTHIYIIPTYFIYNECQFIHNFLLYLYAFVVFLL